MKWMKGLERTFSFRWTGTTVSSSVSRSFLRPPSPSGHAFRRPKIPVGDRPWGAANPRLERAVLAQLSETAQVNRKNMLVNDKEAFQGITTKKEAISKCQVSDILHSDAF